MSSRRKLIVACVVAIAGLLIWLYWPRKSEAPAPSLQSQKNTATPAPFSSPAPTPIAQNTTVPVVVPTQSEVQQQKERQLQALYSTPISVYGKVVDEKGNPVAGATVEIGINDSPERTGSTHVQTTDGGGLFSLTGVHGIAFSVRASKDGYYNSAESKGQRNVIVPSKDDVPQPSQGQPLVLVLRKKGETEPLIFVSSRQIDIPLTGQPTTIDVATGRTGQGALQITSWLGDTKQARFDWRYQLNLPGGGLVERTGQFDFEAPSDGYQSVTEVNMPTTAEQWSSDVAKTYFAKLPDGRYARISINFYPGDRNFVVVESYVNPTSGNRNLEFDPKKKIKAR